MITIQKRLIIVIFSLNFCIFSVIPILFDSFSEAYAKVTNNPQNFNSLLHKMISCSSKVHCRSDIVDNKRWPLSYFPFLKHMLLSISSVGVWFPSLWTWTGLGDLPWPIEYGSNDGMGHPRISCKKPFNSSWISWNTSSWDASSQNPGPKQ